VNHLAEVQEHDWIEVATGRHALDEDAVLTPIFSAVRREVRPAPDPVDVFRRDPLTAPIPIQVWVPAPTRSRQRRAARGRHHIRAS
jgi:hypothetical protein